MLTKVIEQAKIDHFTKWFERADKIVIVSHVSPDGDAIGSSLGLYHFLDSQEKTVNVIVPNAFPDFLKWMPGSKDILLYDRYKEFADKLGWFYEWTSNGMLKKVIRPDGRPVEFRYDALGRRTAKRYFGKITRWVWNGNVPLHEGISGESITPCNRVCRMMPSMRFCMDAMSA